MLRVLVTFGVSLLIGLAAWPLLATAFSGLFRALCELLLAPLTFGSGGHVSFAAAAELTGLQRAGSWDARMLLAIDGVAPTHAVALNPRRLLYLPLLTLLASILAMPLPWARRWRACWVGALILSALALCSVWLIAAFLFAQVEGLVYTLSPAESGVLRLAYEGWVTPLTSKFVLPLLLAHGLFAWQRRSEGREREGAPAADAHTTWADASRKAKATRRKRRKAAPRARRS